jgi:hypothetical protein
MGAAEERVAGFHIMLTPSEKAELRARCRRWTVAVGGRAPCALRCSARCAQQSYGGRRHPLTIESAESGRPRENGRHPHHRETAEPMTDDEKL